MERPYITPVTSKGQITIPAEVRERLGLRPRDRVRFVVEDFMVRIERELSLDDVFGSVPMLDRALTEAQINEIIQDERAEEYARKHLGQR